MISLSWVFWTNWKHNLRLQLQPSSMKGKLSFTQYSRASILFEREIKFLNIMFIHQGNRKAEENCIRELCCTDRVWDWERAEASISRNDLAQGYFFKYCRSSKWLFCFVLFQLGLCCHLFSCFRALGVWVVPIVVNWRLTKQRRVNFYSLWSVTIIYQMIY